MKEEKTELIVDFVEGRIQPIRFINAIYADSSFEDFFKGSEPIPPYTSVSYGIYQYLIERNFKFINEIVDTQDLLSKYLFSKGIDHKPDNSIIKRYDLLLKSQPKWLDLQPDYIDYLLKTAGDINGKELTNWLKKNISETFIYISAPPKWLQMPNWPIEDNRPLVFVGQIDISKIRHDNSQLYIFYSDLKKEFNLVEQST